MSRTSYLRRPLAALLMGAALAASVVIAAVVLASPAWAATYTVTNNADSGAGSLRQAIIDANATTGVEDTINFDLGSAATITLTSGQLPTITDHAGLTIDGGSADITISGGNQHRVFEVGFGAKLTLSNLTVADGGGLRPNGISNDGTLEVNNSTLSDNSASGIVNFNGTVTVSNSTLSGNSDGFSGGGIANFHGTVTVSNSTLSGNSAVVEGGGISNTGGTLTVSNSTLSGNSVNSDQFPGGGGISNNGGTVTVSNSTFSGNSATLVGGGIYNKGTAMNPGTVTVSNSTFSGNTNNGPFSFGGGGIHNEGGSTATLKNTIVAKSPSASGENCAGTITNGGYNLDSGTSCGFPTNRSSKDPLLGPLADNGGPTMTHALLAGSPAIDKGNSFSATTDQRGLPRPSNFVDIVNAADGSDIGAFELQAPPTQPDTTPPRVISTFPVTGGEVGPAANIRATFSEDMRPASVKDAFKLFKKGSTNQIAAQVSYDAATDTATLNPNNNLRRGATYKAVVTTVAKDMAGNRLDQDSSTAGLQKKVWFFEIG
jgi:hypothetical protein